MIEGEAMQWGYLAIVLGAVMLKNLLGWLDSGERFDLKQFLVTTIPTALIMGYMVFEIEPVWNLKAAFILFVASMGLAKGQTLATKYVNKLSDSIKNR